MTWTRIARATRRLLAGLALTAALLADMPPLHAAPEREKELAAAQALFRRNLQAIRDRNRDAYLACYLDSPDLVRTGPEGPSVGFDGFAAGVGDTWPELFEARDLQLMAVRPGVVYGTYRYRIVQNGIPSSGISERLFVSTTDGWRIAVTTAFPAPPGTPPPPLALVGATLLDGNGSSPVGDAVVVIRGGRIACVGSRDACPLPPGIESLDLSSRYLTPGVIDAHVHFSQSGWVDARPDTVDVSSRYPYTSVMADLAANPERFFRAYLCSGVTGVRDAGGFPWTWRLKAEAEDDPWAPHVEAAGPYLSTIDHSLNLPGERQFFYMKDEAAVREAVAYHAASGSNLVKVWYIPDEKRDRETLSELVRLAGTETHQRGMRFLVHAIGVEEAREAVAAGADVLMHSIIDRHLDDGFVQQTFERGTIYIPTLIVPEGFVDVQRGAFEERYPLDCVDPGTRAKVRQTAALGQGSSDADRIQRARSQVNRLRQVASTNLLQLHAAGVTIALGTDAGSPLVLHGPSVYAEMEAMQEAGLPAMEVLLAATQHAARAMGREDDLGTVEAGKVADLLVLDADPSEDITNLRSLRQVIRAGVVHDRADLLPPAPTEQ